MLVTALALLAALPAPARADAPQQFADLGDFKLESGEVIRNCRVGYRTFGRLDARRSNAVLALTWFTGKSEHLAGFFGMGRLMGGDTYGIAVDALGDGVSSSPSNSAAQPRMKFPRFTIRDMVESQRRLLAQLGITHLEAVLGVSMGGMQAFQWAVSYPGFMDKVIAIHGSPRLDAYDLMLWQAQNDALTLDPAWNGGDYKRQPSGRLIAAITALADIPPGRYNRENPRDRVTANLAKSAKEIEAFDANDRIRQVEAMMAHDVTAPFGGSLARAAGAIKARLLVVVGTSDHIVTPGPALELARAAHATVLELGNDCGHGAASCEFDQVKRAVRELLASAATP
jgi:homoserine O-acetyltransferase